MIRTANGRPVRFFAGLMIAWIAARLASAGFDIAPPQPGPRIAHQSATPLPAIIPMPPLRAATPAIRLPLRPRTPAIPHRPRRPPPVSPVEEEDGISVDLLKFLRFTTGFANRRYADMGDAGTATPPVPLASPLLLPATRAADRWRGSAWLLWRPGGTTPADLASVGRLGGSQAGARLDVDLTPGAPSRTAAYARITSALERPAAPEAALGLSYQPARAIPVSLAAERRIALGRGARDATALMAVGGFGPTPIAGPVEADGYVQTGMVGLQARDLFADGKLSLLAPVARLPLRLGAGVSGGAQPHVARLDIGPEARWRLPLPRVAARIGVEWRARVAGQAAPASGLAVTLAADF